MEIFPYTQTTDSFHFFDTYFNILFLDNNQFTRYNQGDSTGCIVIDQYITFYIDLYPCDANSDYNYGDI